MHESFFAIFEIFFKVESERFISYRELEMQAGLNARGHNPAANAYCCLIFPFIVLVILFLFHNFSEPNTLLRFDYLSPNATI